MATLIIHAPYHRVKGGAKSFERVLADGIGNRYAIYQKDANKLTPGSKVVLLRKDKDKKRAEGMLVKLIEKDKARNGVQRYDVIIKDLVGVPYKGENLGRTGVAVI